MLVRTATLEDLGTLVDFGKRLTQESPKFQKQGFSIKRARAFFTQVIEQSNSIFMVCDAYDNPVGTLVALISVDWRTGQRIAFEQGVYVVPEYRNSGAGIDLVNTFIDWAKVHNADRIQIGTMTGIKSERTVSLYESLGFELSAYTLEMEV